MSDAFFLEQQLNAARNRIAELEELVYRLELAQELRDKLNTREPFVDVRMMRRGRKPVQKASPPIEEVEEP